jgi:hypothetical protein
MTEIHVIVSMKIFLPDPLAIDLATGNLLKAVRKPL